MTLQFTQCPSRSPLLYLSAKAAQKQCSELFMLDLLHKRPHVERALVVAIEVSLGRSWGGPQGERQIVPLPRSLKLSRHTSCTLNTSGPAILNPGFEA